MLPRFIALSRFAVLLASLLAQGAAISQAAPRLMQGPMLGEVTHSSARIWARVGGEHELVVCYSPSPRFAKALYSESVRALPENDYCVEIQLEDLDPGSFYYYKILLDGQELDSPAESEGYPLLTAPGPNHLAKFTIAFGSAARVDADGLQAIWLQVQNARPHAFIWLGNNAPIAQLTPEFQAEHYRRQRDVPFLQPLLRSIPQLATWDADRTLSGRASTEALDVFQRYWANPKADHPDARGAYFKYAYGSVDFFVLDAYTHRDEQGASTILGERQLRWLKNHLAASDARFKILLSSASWSNAPEVARDSWLAFPAERADLFGFIKEEDIHGVVLVSGDDDEAEIKALPFSDEGAYDLYELVSSPLAQEPQQAYQEDSQTTIAIQEPYAESMNFGLLSFDMTVEDPTLSFEVVNVFGNSVYPPFVLRASELRNGIASWKTKIDAETLAYLEREAKAAAN